ncbi:MAG: PDZ domain-containing protein [Coxiella endosymbiont of Dermacentor nuttalli]
MTTIVANPKEMFIVHKIPLSVGMCFQKFSDLEPDGTFLNSVLVTNINDDSGGALAGLQPGDIILSANGQITSTVNELIRVAEKKPNDYY